MSWTASVRLNVSSNKQFVWIKHALFCKIWPVFTENLSSTDDSGAPPNVRTIIDDDWDIREIWTGTWDKFAIWLIRETLRDISQTRIGDRKKLILMRERVQRHEILISCYTTFLFSLNLFDLSSTTVEISLFHCSSVWRLILVVFDSLFKIEKFLCKMAISFSDLKSWTAKSIFRCRLNWLRAQVSLFTSTLG